MDGASQQEMDFSQLIPAFQSGGIDGFNPCMFATALVFVILMAHISYRPLHVILFGCCFYIIHVVTEFLSVFGIFDAVTTHPVLSNVIRVFYALLATGFLILGVVHFRDWWRLKKYNDPSGCAIEPPMFLGERSADKNMLRDILQTLLLMAVAYFLTFFSAIYPQSEYIYIVHSYMMAGGDAGFSRNAFMIYVFSVSWPVLLAWLAIWMASFFKKQRDVFMSFYKCVLSGCLFATGGMLLYYFLV